MLTRCLLLAMFVFVHAQNGLAQKQEPVSKEDALRALRDLGADVEHNSGRCAGCHDPNMYNIHEWINQGSQVQYKCLAKEDSEDGLSALERVNCLRDDERNPKSKFSAKNLGIFAGAAHLSIFKNIFLEAFPNDPKQIQYQRFIEEAGMPRHSDKLSESAFDNIRKWAYDSKAPAAFLEEILGGPVESPQECNAESSPELISYLQDKARRGWSVRNAQEGMPMFACAGANDSLSCFTQQRNGVDVFKKVSESVFAHNWTRSSLVHEQRLLSRLNYKTSYWSRVSPDGRYIGNGLDAISDDGYGARISDLRPKLEPEFTRDAIDVLASFDPSFFPDGSGFMFQGRFNGFCSQQILNDRSTTKIDFTELGCSRADVIPLYQSVGANLDGADYFAAAGVFTGDSGFGDDNQTPMWLKRSFLKVIRLVFDGTVFQPSSISQKWTPFIGDYQMSPSTGLLVGRIAGLIPDTEVNRQLGYTIQQLTYDESAEGEDAITIKPVAKICAKGGKASFSFDERFVATYATVNGSDFAEFGFSDPEDPDFLQRVGSSNIYLFDLLTGETHRLTDMRNGHRAKFPMFRSDGWLYYLTIVGNNQEWIAASDAAIRLSLKRKTL